jgi:hypothetical protein
MIAAGLILIGLLLIGGSIAVVRRKFPLHERDEHEGGGIG